MKLLLIILSTFAFKWNKSLARAEGRWRGRFLMIEFLVKTQHAFKTRKWKHLSKIEMTMELIYLLCCENEINDTQNIFVWNIFEGLVKLVKLSSEGSNFQFNNSDLKCSITAIIPFISSVVMKHEEPGELYKELKVTSSADLSHSSYSCYLTCDWRLCNLILHISATHSS